MEVNLDDAEAGERVGLDMLDVGVVMRPAIWSGGRPVYCQATPITGMLMFGKMSVGVRKAASGPMMKINRASTTKV
jgi:hypothetical protein